MYAKTNHALSVLLVAMLASAGVAAQTIDELTEMRKKQLIAEMKKGTTPEPTKPVVVQSVVRVDAPSAAMPKPEKPKLIVPDFEVLSIFGANPASLTAVISETRSRNIRVRANDSTASGWLVERITPGEVTFRKELVAEPLKAAEEGATAASKRKRSSMTKGKPADKSEARETVVSETKFHRVVVGIGAVPARAAASAAPAATTATAQQTAFQGVPAVIPR